MDPIEDVLRSPTRREDWVRTVLIGGALTLLGVLVVPAILVSGYALDVIRGRIAGEAGTPAFENWGDLLMDGIKVWIVGFVYAILPALLGVGLFGGSIAAIASGSDVGLALGLLGVGLGSLLFLVVSLVLLYLLPASLANLAATDRLGAAFDATTVRQVVTSREYAIPWLWALGVAIVGGAVANALVVIPLLGWIAGALLLFYVEVVLAVLWGIGFAEARDRAGETAAAD